MDQDTKKAIKGLREFLQKNMITKQEIDDRFETLPTREDFHQLQVSVDGIAKNFKDDNQELQIVGARTSRMEAWMVKAATKIGLRYIP